LNKEIDFMLISHTARSKLIKEWECVNKFLKLWLIKHFI